MQGQRDTQQSQICISNAFSAWGSINHLIAHTHDAANTEYKHASCSTPQGGWEKEALNPPRFQHYGFWAGIIFFFQIDHKSTFKNSKLAFLLLLPLLSFDFFFNTFLSLCLCMAFFFFPFIWVKSEDNIIVLWSLSVIIDFFSLKSNIGRYILQWWAYLNKSKQFSSSAEPKITTFSPLNCQKTCYHQNESSCLQSRKRLLNLVRTSLLLNYLEMTTLKFSLFCFFYLMPT